MKNDDSCVLLFFVVVVGRNHFRSNDIIVSDQFTKKLGTWVVFPFCPLYNFLSFDNFALVCIFLLIFVCALLIQAIQGETIASFPC